FRGSVQRRDSGRRRRKNRHSERRDRLYREAFEEIVPGFRIPRRQETLNRRVVVTGVGLLCGGAIRTEEVWRSVLAGKSGIGPITLFDAAAFDPRIAGEVRGFDPHQWV